MDLGAKLFFSKMGFHFRKDSYYDREIFEKLWKNVYKSRLCVDMETELLVNHEYLDDDVRVKNMMKYT